MRGRALAFGGCMLAASFLLGGVARSDLSMDVSPDSQPFGALCVGSHSGPKKFTVENKGSDPLTISKIARSNSQIGAADFSPDNVAPPSGSLAMGEKFSFNVTFAPSAHGGRSAMYKVETTAGDESVNVSGTGIDRRLAADRSTVTFGNQRVDTRSPTQNLLIRNSGGDSVTVTDIALHGAQRGDFIATVPGQPFTIKAGDVRTVTLAFQPSAAGARRGSIEFTSNACATPKLAVSLVGTGVDPNVVVNPSPVAAGASPKGTQGPAVPVSVSNDGGAALKITAIQLVGPAADDFELAGLPVMPTTVPPSGSFVFSVRMTPSDLGLRTATINVISDDPDAPTLAVPVRGTGGTASPSASPSPTRTASPTALPTSTGSRSASPQALGAPGNDSLAVGLVIAGVVVAFAGLVVIRRLVTSSDED